jgi:hypothetical protein
MNYTEFGRWTVGALPWGRVEGARTRHVEVRVGASLMEEELFAVMSTASELSSRIESVDSVEGI